MRFRHHYLALAAATALTLSLAITLPAQADTSDAPDSFGPRTTGPLNTSVEIGTACVITREDSFGC